MGHWEWCSRKEVFQVKTTTVELLHKSTNEVAIKLVVSAQQLEPYTCLLDIGAGLNWVSKTLLKKEWRTNINTHQLPCICTAKKESISPDGTILLLIHTGDLSARVWYAIVQNLAVDISLGSSFINRQIQRIFPSERKVVPSHSSPVPIPSSKNSVAAQHHIGEQDWKNTCSDHLHSTKNCVPVT